MSFPLFLLDVSDVQARLRRPRCFPERLGYITPETHIPKLPVISTNRLESRKCVRYFIPEIINSNYLDVNVFPKLSTHSLQGFYNYAKNHIIAAYDETCHVEHCYICQS